MIVAGAFLGIMVFAYAFSGRPSAPGESAGETPAAPVSEGQPAFVRQQIEAYQQVLKYDPKNVGALVGLGNMYHDARKWQQAADYYQQALAVEPKRADVRTDMGIAYFNLGLNEVAEGEFRKVLEQQPRHANASYNLGIVLHATGRTAAARKVWLATLPYAKPELAARIHQLLGDQKS